MKKPAAGISLPRLLSCLFQLGNPPRLHCATSLIFMYKRKRAKTSPEGLHLAVSGHESCRLTGSPPPAGSHANPVPSTPPGYAWRSGIYISQTLRPQEPEHLLQALPVLAAIDARSGFAGRATKTISEPSPTVHPARRLSVGHFASCPIGLCPIVPGIALYHNAPFRSRPCPTALEPALPKTRSPELARNPWN